MSANWYNTSVVVLFANVCRCMCLLLSFALCVVGLLSDRACDRKTSILRVENSVPADAGSH